MTLLDVWAAPTSVAHITAVCLSNGSEKKNYSHIY